LAPGMPQKDGVNAMGYKREDGGLMLRQGGLLRDRTIYSASGDATTGGQTSNFFDTKAR